MRFNESNEDENGGEIPCGIFIGNLDTNRDSTKLSDDHMQYRNHCKRRYAKKNKWAMLGLKPTFKPGFTCKYSWWDSAGNMAFTDN